MSSCHFENCQVVAIVQHIPTVNLSVILISGTYVAPGGGFCLIRPSMSGDITTERGLSGRNRHGRLTTTLICDNCLEETITGR